MATINDDDAGHVLNGTTGDDTINGNGGDDTITGGGGTDTVSGGEGNDTITSSGHGTYSGDAGNDLIYAANGLPETLDGGTGTDTLDVTSYTGNYIINLATGVTNFGGESFVNFENLTAGIGADTLTGTGGANIIHGGDGNDIINGAGGSDSSYGDAGDDYIYAVLGTPETVDGGDGTDTLDTTAFTGNYVVNLATGLTNFSGESFVNMENLIAGVGADTLTGTGGANTIHGGDGNDIINGAGGSDSSYGDAGDDYIYAVLGTPETVDGGDGTDTLDTTAFTGDYTVNLTTGLTNWAGESFTNMENLTSGVGNDTLTGTSGVNLINGGNGSDTIDGAGGADTVHGDDGNDILTSSGAGSYYGDAGDDLIKAGIGNPEVLDGGTGTDTLDTTSWSGDYVINLVTGATNWTGEAFTNFENLTAGAGNDTLTGTDGVNIIKSGDGADRVDGGLGADKMVGGTGNDTYVVENANDKAVESNNAGTDLIEASLSFALTGLYVENLTLTGTGNFTAGGNGFDNVLTGNSGNNTLNGGLNADTMNGGAGNDLYFVDNAGDVVVENANEGKDAVNASITYTLGANVETLVLIGYQAINGTGNGLDNTLTGNGNANTLNGGAGKDILIGQGGNDILTGGAGADQFRFYAAGAANGLDHITDFVSGTDKLAFKGSDYGLAAGHTLTAAELHTGAAVGSNGQFLYNTVNHILYWDADGAGGSAAVAVVQFDNAAVPGGGDFLFL